MASCTLDKLLDFENRENSLHEQDGGINVMSMGRNGSSLAWMTKIPSTNKMAELTLCLWEEMGLVWPG